MTKPHNKLLVRIGLVAADQLPLPAIRAEVLEIAPKIHIQELAQLVVATLPAQLHPAPADKQVRQSVGRLEPSFGHAGQIVIAAEPLHVKACRSQAGGQIGINARAADILRQFIGKFTPDNVTPAVVGQALRRIQRGDGRQFSGIKGLVIGGAGVCVHAVFPVKDQRSLDAIALRFELDNVLVVRTARHHETIAARAKGRHL